MKKQLHIINIDGLEGVGQTTQINLLYKYFKELNIPVLRNTLTDTLQSAQEMVVHTRNFLKHNPNGIVLNDGSIAEMIVIDMSKCIPNTILDEKYRSIMDEHNYLNQDFGMCNILLVPEDIDMCMKRITKRAKITKEIPNLTKLQYQMDIIKGMQFFDHHTISRQLKFNILNIEEHFSMLEVHGLILKLLTQTFEIKKPSEEG